MLSIRFEKSKRKGYTKAMVLPQWIPFLIALWVIAFGIMRIRIATKKEDKNPNRPNYRKGGYYSRSQRSHMLFGIAYLALGGYCIAMGFGYSFTIISCTGGESTQTIKTDKNAVPVRIQKNQQVPE